MADNAYDDDLSPEEQAELKRLDDADRTVTAPSDDGGAPGVLPDDSDGAAAALVAEAEAEAARKAKPAAADPATPPADPAADPAAPTPPAPPADEDLATFIERHKDKTPAELAELIANRGKRANRQAFQQRRGRSPEQIAADREALRTRRTNATQGKDTFKATLATDPDAATEELNNRLADAELERVAQAEAALDAEEQNARLDEAISMGDKYIPEFRTVYPDIVEFGKNVGYSPEELDAIDDGRDLVVLNLARIAGQLIVSKVIDRTGKLLPAIQPTTETPQDPRLRAPAAPATHGGAPGGGPALTIDKQIDNALGMSDADFDKLSDSELARMMGATGNR